MKNASEKYGYDSHFPTRLRELMGLNKVSQTVMAELCGVQRQSISLWYNGDTRPDIISLGKIAQHFGVSTDYLLGLTDIKSTDKATKELCSTLGLSEETIQALMKTDNPIRIKKNLTHLWQFNLLDTLGEVEISLSDLLNWLVADHKEEIEKNGAYYDNSLLTNLNAFFTLVKYTELLEKKYAKPLDNIAFITLVEEADKFGLLLTSSMYDIQTSLNNKRHGITEQLSQLLETLKGDWQ